MPNIEFEYSRFDTDHYVDQLRHIGAVVLRHFILPTELDKITDQVMAEPFEPVDQIHGTVHEQFGLQEWNMQQSPESIRALAYRMGELVRQNGVLWRPNAARAQLYEPGASGVDWHRDFQSSLLVVGVANIFGEAQFDTKLANEEQSVVLVPGDVALLRNVGLNDVDDRVEHRVHAPKNGTRLSLGIRQDSVT
jgi:hypothetical protein